MFANQVKFCGRIYVRGGVVADVRKRKSCHPTKVLPEACLSWRLHTVDQAWSACGLGVVGDITPGVASCQPAIECCAPPIVGLSTLRSKAPQF